MEEETFLQTKRMDNLNTCSTVKDAFVQHGLAPDDKIDRREQVLMFRTVETEMEVGLKSLMSSGRFDEAKEMGSRLESLREEFGGLQKKDENEKQNKQKKLFDKAVKIKGKQLKEKHNAWEKEVEEACTQFQEDTDKTFKIQRENLALEMNRIERPRMKYSKTRMEYKNAEIRLCALKQYDDAKNVRRMLKSIDAKEEEVFNKAFDDKMQAKIDKLSTFQKGTAGRLEEKMSAFRWKEHRKREKEDYVSKTNINNKSKDMTHSMFLDARLKPELTVKPSALLVKRANFKSNASKLRGEQLLDKVKGKKEGDAVFIESLCNLHDFSDKKLSGTKRFEEKIQWKGYKSGQKHFNEKGHH
ncbi:hypothetical protein TL16_g06774 [Triparma laevis f. inornata]|uniref:Uncharacterized protein n=2 Tax=Triparma laevis TaxID=1534972 RepID=A0A9W7CEB0_9STRA|nr:hypothetical protein TL16_g06774 [Triparma laevis f. inornata]GMI06732.1 hypothetical protein TrLO_g8036 [Triparma laevis f. longispina]